MSPVRLLRSGSFKPSTQVSIAFSLHGLSESFWARRQRLIVLYVLAFNLTIYLYQLEIQNRCFGTGLLSIHEQVLGQGELWQLVFGLGTTDGSVSPESIERDRRPQL